MGSMESILKMIPGAGKALKQMQGTQLPDKELKKIEAIINSMTARERRDHRVLNGSRRLRIARGSGTTVQDVNQLLKRFTEAQKMMKKMQKMGPQRPQGHDGARWRSALLSRGLRRRVPGCRPVSAPIIRVSTESEVKH